MVSRDGRRAYIGTKNDILVFDLQKWELLGAYRAHVGCVLSLALSADDRVLVSGGEDGTLRVWDTTEKGGKLKKELPVVEENKYGKGYLHRVDASPKGDRVSAVIVYAGGQTRFVIWDAVAGEKVTGYEKMPAGYQGAKFLGRADHWAYARPSGRVTAWLKPGDGETHVHIDDNVKGWVALDVTPNGDRLLTFDSEGVARLWRVDVDEQRLARISTQPTALKAAGSSSVSISGDGRHAALTNGKTVQVIRLVK